MDISDRESLIDETHNLCDYVRKASKTYHFDCKKVVAIGYASGANIAISVLFHYEQAFYKAIFLFGIILSNNFCNPNI